MNRLIISLILLALSFPSISNGPKTHCGDREEVFFSCPIYRSEKTVSLCREKGADGTLQWVQYRFGVVGRAEMVFPSERDGSLTKFAGLRQVSRAVNYELLEIWFGVGAFDYLIEHSADCEEECQGSNSLTVFKRGHSVAKFSCSQPVVNNLWGLLPSISDDQSSRP